jgi:hypothetical protein
LLCLDADTLDVNKHEDADADDDGVATLAVDNHEDTNADDDGDGDASLDVNDQEDADGGFDLNDLEHGKHANLVFFSTCTFFSIDLSCSYLDYRFDLDLPLDEFGAVDFDYVQNLAGKHAYIPVDFFFTIRS